ncbi:MAG: helix-turn-helix domain-containing protein [Acidobacteriia bacterium]|nr:helix-turn-helix domain-containing protein [Terriglobia bacterium]
MSVPLSLPERIEEIPHALTARQLAEILNVSPITSFKHAKAGRLPSFSIGTAVRFCPRSVAAWLRRNGTGLVSFREAA